MDKPVSQVLEEAADLLAKPGAWTQGEYGGINGGCHCVLGAIRLVGNFGHDMNEPTVFFGNHIDDGLVCEWNDDPDRTQAEVVAKLREAAALAKEQGR